MSSLPLVRSATHVAFEGPGAERLLEFGLTRVVHESDRLAMGPSRLDVLEHVRARKAWFHVEKSWDPCNQQCESNYNEVAAGCGRIADAAQRKACQDTAYATYKSCRAACQQLNNEKCKQACDKVYNKCMDNCKTDKCRNECFADYVVCLRECDR